MVLKEPSGVVTTIVTWNYPILLMTWKVAPALAAGNTVVLKPSEMTPLTTLLFAEFFAHLPPGVINIELPSITYNGEGTWYEKENHLGRIVYQTNLLAY